MRDDPDALRRALRDDDPAALPALYDRCGTARTNCLRAMLGSTSAADDALPDVMSRSRVRGGMSLPPSRAWPASAPATSAPDPLLATPVCA